MNSTEAGSRELIAKLEKLRKSLTVNPSHDKVMSTINYMKKNPEVGD